MRVLLVNPPKEQEFSLFVLDDYNTKARSNQPPIGLMYLASYIKPYHEVKILDMNAKEMRITNIEKEINSYCPDLIGITCVISKWKTVRALSTQIKKINKRIPVAVGGVNPSLYPYETLQHQGIDYVISGFGQAPLLHLCDSIKRSNINNKIIDDIPNCYTINNCNKETKGNFNFSNIDDFPFPDRQLLSIEDYIMPFFPENPTTSMMTSLGCPYKCSFCACKNFKPVRLRKTNRIISEMKDVERLGIKSVLFQDELFTMSTKRIREICRGIIKSGVRLNWSVRSRANLVNSRSLDLMKEAGCFNVHLGIESGTNRILKEMKKGLTVREIKQSVAMIKQAGLSCTASFMIGYPNETEKEILETIEFARNLELNNCQFFITQPEPGTELYNDVAKTNLLSPGYGGDIYSKFTLNPDKVDLKENIASNIFTREQLIEYIQFAYSLTKNLYGIKKNAYSI
jgi:radical SAM superfamily enzyme YgiQ (UPF0313 family)